MKAQHEIRAILREQYALSPDEPRYNPFPNYEIPPISDEARRLIDQWWDLEKIREQEEVEEYINSVAAR